MKKQSTNKWTLERSRRTANALMKKPSADPLLNQVLTDLLWVVDHQQDQLEQIYDWTKYIIEQSFVDHARGDGTVQIDQSCHEAIKDWHHTETVEAQTTQESGFGINESLSDAQLDSIRTRIANWLMPQHGDMVALVAEVERLRGKLSEAYALLASGESEERLKRAAGLLEIVRKVAEADNSDHSVCYQLCSYDMHWTDDDHQVMTHNTPCVVEQARALLGLE